MFLSSTALRVRGNQPRQTVARRVRDRVRQPRDTGCYRATGLPVSGPRTFRCAFAAPALGASMAAVAISGGDFGRSGCLPALSAEPVTARVVTGFHFNVTPASHAKVATVKVDSIESFNTEARFMPSELYGIAISPRLDNATTPASPPRRFTSSSISSMATSSGTPER